MYEYIFPQYIDNNVLSNTNNNNNSDFSQSTNTTDSKNFVVNNAIYEKTLKNMFIKEMLNFLNRQKPEKKTKGDDFEEIVEKIKLNKQLIVFKRISFAILAISVLVVVAILVKLCVDYKPDGSLSLTSEALECSTIECQHVLEDIYKNIDTSVNPCDDFYQFACGNWINEHKVKLQKYEINSFNRFKELAKNNFDLLSDILVKKTHRNLFCDSALCKVKNYFHVCVQDSLNKTNQRLFLTEIRRFLHSIGGWPLVSNSYDGKKWNLVNSLVVLQSYKLFPFFTSTVISDPHNSSTSRLTFIENKKKLIDEKVNFISFAVKLAEEINLEGGSVVSRIKLQKCAKEIYLFEVKLLKIINRLSLQKSKQLLSKSSYNLYDYKSLEQIFNCKTDDLFSVDRYLKIVLHDGDPHEQKYFIQTPSYFRHLCTLLSKTDKTVIANYIGFYALHELIPYMPLKYRLLKEEARIKRRDVHSIKLISSLCVKQTDDAFGYATGALFLKYVNLNDSIIDDIYNLTASLKETFIESIPDIEWMDSETKKNAIYKAQHMNINVGYPRWIRNETRLDAYYSRVVIGNLTFSNTLSVRHFNRMNSLKKISSPTDRSEWNMAPLEVNAYYTQSKNTIGFPIGILRDPFYNQYATRALNYGRIGMVIGHEITHAFDATGRGYDAFGNMNNWWGNVSTLHFKLKSECFNKQYSSYMIEKKGLNGLMTLDENIADNGGLKLAYKAYRKYFAKHKTQLQSKFDILTPEKLFFIGFAQSFCSISNRKHAEGSINADPHSFAKYRVIGALTNSLEFSNAFSCPLSSPMNPPEKCRIWTLF